ncbi:MAG TPA: Fe-S protein assembly co-chaperone HscB [Phycisphaerae bacterium]|nr:Fe-S protein assembly co-chaperone HscB [Phycisphaerae bacterium]
MASTDQTVPSKCLSCSAELESPIVCTGCHKLYPVPEPLDYFELFRLPHRYRIDLGDLEHRFLAITRNVHPDFFTGHSEDMCRLAVRLSAELNEAYRVLKDPVLRAGYLLEQSGGRSASEDHSVPPSVLSEVMMLREELEAAEGDQTAAASVRRRVVARRGEILTRIAELADDLANAGDEDKTTLRSLLNSVKYYENLLAELPVG